MSHRIVFIGAGNLATHLSLELKRKGFSVIQVFSRTAASANQLARKLHSNYTTTPGEILPHADIYFVALKDSAYADVLPHVAFGNNLLVHCSGSLPLSVLEKYSKNTGVFYPLQTFSKGQTVNFNEIPVFIEANSKAIEKKLQKIAGKISGKVMVMDSKDRLFLHVSAVFVCNFVNHFYTVAAEVLKSKEIPFGVLRPLILETAGKVQKMEPAMAQTGPAVRYDKNVISAHLKALQAFPEFSKLYENITESIFKYHKNS